MKQYKITSSDLNQSSDQDCYLDPSDPIQELRALSGLGGLGGAARLHEYRAQQTSYGETLSKEGTSKAEYMRKNNIRAGDPEWFKLWFSLPYMTGEKSRESK
jgi:hypothetical protein